MYDDCYTIFLKMTRSGILVSESHLIWSPQPVSRGRMRHFFEKFDKNGLKPEQTALYRSQKIKCQLRNHFPHVTCDVSRGGMHHFLEKRTNKG
jgi:hypothetical protein